MASEIRLLALLGAVLVPCGLAAAEPDLAARIGAQLGEHAVVRAEFTQSRELAAMNRPLVATGRLVYSRQYGTLWQVEAPRRSSYLLGEERIVEIGADGARRERRMRDVPGLAQMGRVLRGMFGADFARLREDFEIAVTGDLAQWQMTLTPRQAQVAQVIAGLRLSGGRFLESVRIDEASGDATQIRFRDSQAAQALEPAEAQLFGAPARQ